MSAPDNNKQSDLQILFPDSLLVSDSENPDVVGMLTYGIFARAKLDWRIAYHKKNGSWPNDVASEAYNTFWTQDRKYAMRSEAEGILFAFAENVQKSTEESVRKRQSQLYFHIFTNLLGTSIAVIIALLAYFVLNLTNVSRMLQQIWK